MKKNSIQVLMIGPALKMKGGVSSVQKIFLEHWDDKDFAIHHLATTNDGNLLKKIATAIQAIIRFFFLSLTLRPSIAHIHFSSRVSFYRKSIFVLLACFLRQKVILHAHGGEFRIFYEDESNYLQKRYIRYILNSSSRLIVLSNSWKFFYKKLLKNRTPVVLYNPIYLPRLSSRQKGLIQSVLFLGKLERAKGIYDLLAAIPYVLKYFPDVQFLLGGNGEIDNVKLLVTKQALKHNVQLLGWVQDAQKTQLLEQETIFVLPSYNEGLPMSVLEAMAYGLPVIVTPVGGIPELIENGKSGIFVKPGKPEGLALAIIKLLDNPALSAKMGEAARREIEENFDARKIINQLKLIYASTR